MHLNLELVEYADNNNNDLLQAQIPNAGQLQHALPGATCAPRYESEPPLDQADRVRQASSSSSRPRLPYRTQLNNVIYESLRETLGYANGATVDGDSLLLAMPVGQGTTSKFVATTVAPAGAAALAAHHGVVDNMDLQVGWNHWQVMSLSVQSEAAASFTHHWDRRAGTPDMMMRVHDHHHSGLESRRSGALEVLQAPDSMSWYRHASVAASPHAYEAPADVDPVNEKFGMEERSAVNWGNLATSGTRSSDAGERMDSVTSSPSSWEDLRPPMPLGGFGAGQKGRLLDYSLIDPTSRHGDARNCSLASFLSHTPTTDQSDATGGNFLILSPGFFRVDRFPQQHQPSTGCRSITTATEEH